MRLVPVFILVSTVGSWPARAQTPDPPQHHHHQEEQSRVWHLMQDGVTFFTLNGQGGPRGGTDFGAQNWWMGMASRPAAGGTIRFNVMLSLDPLTLGNNGYRQIFQAGETLDGRPLIDRQHPHDFLMQAAAIWSRPLRNDFVLTLAGAPVGEPALGPVAFMHRASALENPTAPLGHHTFDSTHIAMGVLTAALRRGPWEVESSLFNGREPDEQRWDLMDPGPLDSWALRAWFRPGEAWAFQASHGYLREPESLEPGNVRRTTVSGSWTRRDGSRWTAITLAFGRNDKHQQTYDAWLGEATHAVGRMTGYTRIEWVQVETDVLLSGTPHGHHDHGPASSGRNYVGALTVGLVSGIAQVRGWEVGVGIDGTLHVVPDVLKITHGNKPKSGHIFLRVRPPALSRMLDAIMIRGH